MTRQLSIQDAAQHFNVSKRTIRHHIKQGTLKADLIDGRYLVHVCVDSDMTPDKPDVNVLSCQHINLKHSPEDYFPTYFFLAKIKQTFSNDFPISFWYFYI